MTILDVELKTYEDNKEQLIKEHLNKYVLIKNVDILGIFNSENEAYNSALDKLGNVPFLVKKIQEVEQKQYYTSSLIKLTD